MIAKAIYGILSNDVTIDGYVGDKIYPVVIPQNSEFPAISFYISSDTPDHQKVDASTQSSTDVQIKCVHDSYETNTDLSAAVQSALDKIKGTYYGVEIQATFFNGTDDLYDSQAQKFMKILNFNFTYKY